MIPQEELSARKEGTDRIEGGAFDGVMDKQTPFMYKVCILLIAGAENLCIMIQCVTNISFIFQGGEGVNAGVGETEWVVAKDRYKYDQTFDSLNPIDGKVTGAGK